MKHRHEWVMWVVCLVGVVGVIALAIVGCTHAGKKTTWATQADIERVHTHYKYEVERLKELTARLVENDETFLEELKQVQFQLDGLSAPPPPISADELHEAGVLSLGGDSASYGDKLVVGDGIAIHWDEKIKHYVEDKSGEKIMLMSYKDKDTGEMVHLPGRTKKAIEADPRKSDKGPAGE